MSASTMPPIHQDIDSIRDILLEEDRYRFQLKIDELERELSKCRADMATMRQEYLDYVKLTTENLQSEMQALNNKPASSKIFHAQLMKCKPELIDVLGPQMGKLVRKSVSSQIDELNQRLLQSTEKVYSLLNPTNIFNRILGKTKIHQLNHPKIIQLFIIGKSTGILLAKYQQTDHMKADADALAGMFTAIKGFAETAFATEGAELDLIDYGDYSIKLMNYGSCYYAIIFTGSYTPDFDKIIVEGIDSFADKHMIQIMDNINKNYPASENEKIITPYFDKLCQRLERKLSY